MCYKNVYGGQSSKGFLVDHHPLVNKQRSDTELNRDIVKILVERRTNVQKKKKIVYKLSMLEV